MLEDTRRQQWLKFVLGIILPTLLAIAISVVSIYLVVIPAFEKSFLDSKRQMIRELTQTAWSILAYYEGRAAAGSLSTIQAQRQAAAEIEQLRYGEGGRDYFWISDLQPRLIMHPYAKELLGSDLASYRDANGKRVFLEIKELVAEQQGAFIDYVWHRKYEEKRDVAKLSYVQRFDPWGWVVGTGMYLDDVEARKALITRRLNRLILAAASICILLLLVVTYRSLSIERQRRRAEQRLVRSRRKYKALVESAAEPIMLVHEGRCLYANQSLQRLTGYRASELEAVKVAELFAQEGDSERDRGLLERLEREERFGEPVEARMVSRGADAIPVTITLTPKQLGSQQAIVLTVRDLSARRRMSAELDASRERYRLLTNRLNIGVFRTEAAGRLRLLEANPVFLQLIGRADGYDWSGVELLDLLESDPAAGEIPEMLRRDGYLKERLFRFKREDGSFGSVSLSMVLTRGDHGEPMYCDGLIEDVSRQQQVVREREELIVELQTALMFLNQPVRNVAVDFVSCEAETTVQAAAKLMSEHGRSAILVRSGSGAMVGIVTDTVFRERVLTEAMGPQTPVSEIMSSPLIQIEESALVFEAILLLRERGIKHLAVSDSGGVVVSLLSSERLLDLHRFSVALMLEEVRTGNSAADLARSHQRLPRLIKGLIDSGAHAGNITRLVTAVSDAIVCRLIELAVEQQGEPPAGFAFICLGSEGRGEQTLATDQDNALVLEDVEEARQEQVREYFLGLGALVCTWLDEVGYAFCRGETMAMNPRWCQPLRVWKGYFSKWIAESGPKELMEASIFFDLRFIHGDRKLIGELREHIFAIRENKGPFLYQLAQNTLQFRIPLDFFGRIAVPSDGDHPHAFDIKPAITQIVSFARIHAIAGRLENPNTLRRLESLLAAGVLNRAAYEELAGAYNYLMQLRFRHQVTLLDREAEPDNLVDIRELSQFELEMLEKVLNQVNALRKRLSLMGGDEFSF